MLILTHALLNIFLHVMGCCVADDAGNLDLMPDVFAHIDAVALEIPPAPVFCNQLVLLGIVPVLQTTSDRAAFCMRVVRVLGVSHQSPADKYHSSEPRRNSNSCHRRPPSC